MLSGATAEDARARFDAVQATLAAAPEPFELRVGFAVLGPTDNAEELIGRADAELPVDRRS